MLADASILLHVFDGWEKWGEEWAPESRTQGVYGSIIFQDQHQPGRAERMPIFGCEAGYCDWAGSGFILRPGHTPIRSGAGGEGSSWECGSPPAEEVVTDDLVRGFEYPGDGCKGLWNPNDIGRYLERQARWQRMYSRLGHNEVIVDGHERYAAALPWAIDAFFVYGRGGPLPTGDSPPADPWYSRGVPREEPWEEPMAIRVHAAFHQRYPELSAADVPLVFLDPDNWMTPFSLPDIYEGQQEGYG